MTAAVPAHGGLQRLGPFVVRGPVHETAAASVLAGAGVDGSPVDLVVLGPGPSSDGAARDRFRAAVDELAATTPGVLAADLRSPLPWVALPSHTSGGATGSGPVVSRLLATVVPGGSPGPAEPSARHGPDFSPYWSGGGYQPRPAPALAAAAPSRSSRWWWVVLALVLLLLLLLLWWLLDRSLQEQEPQPVPAPTQTSTPDEPTPSGPPTDSPAPPPSPGTAPGFGPSLPAFPASGATGWAPAPTGR